MGKMKAKIFEIKRFAVHDGDGIRTTVFLKGCPLKCVWCHNPEGIGFSEQIACYENKCIGCGECITVCPSGAHKIEDGVHSFDRAACIGCGRCAEACLGDALVYYGKKMTPEELLPILLEDKSFYDASGGGVTASGGECLCHADFCAELFKLLKDAGVNTAIDTCGLVDKSAIDKLLPYTDTFLYDVKAVDTAIHERCTGKPNARIIENLKYIDGCGARIEVRVPYVPEYNDGEMEKIAELLSGIKNLVGVRVLPYHNYAGSKYASLGMENTLPSRVPTDEEMTAAKEIFKSFGIKVI